MARKFKVDILSQSSIKNLQKELTKYRGSLQDKSVELAKRLSDIGLRVTDLKINESPLGKYVSVQSSISEEEAGCRAVIMTTGKIFQSPGFPPFNVMLAIEFGAGIHYNDKENPYSKKMGFGVGSFPGQMHAFDKEGWFYWDDTAQGWRHSYGVKATMPLFYAYNEIFEKAKAAAKEVFGK